MRSRVLPSLNEELLLSFTRAHEQSNENNESKTPLLSVVVYCGYDAVSGGVYCACVKANKRMGLSVKRFPLKLLLPFFLSINWAVFWSLFVKGCV